jgi:hypothetical protein
MVAPIGAKQLINRHNETPLNDVEGASCRPAREVNARKSSRRGDAEHATANRLRGRVETAPVRLVVGVGEDSCAGADYNGRVVVEHPEPWSLGSNSK